MLANLPQLDRMRKSIFRSNPKSIATYVSTVIDLKHQVMKSKLGMRKHPIQASAASG